MLIKNPTKIALYERVKEFGGNVEILVVYAGANSVPNTVLKDSEP